MAISRVKQVDITNLTTLDSIQDAINAEIAVQFGEGYDCISTSFELFNSVSLGPRRLVRLTFVDQASLVTSSLPWKSVAADVATTENVTLSGIQVIDAEAGFDNMRVAVWKQTDKKENGVWSMHSGAWTRTTDATNDVDFQPGACWFVSTGDLYGNNFLYVTNDSVVVGVDDIEFALLGNTAVSVAEPIYNDGTPTAPVIKIRDASHSTSGAMSSAHFDAVATLVVALGTVGLLHSNGSGGISSSLAVNADISNTAAIAGTKIASNFGGQTVVSSVGFEGPYLDNPSATLTLAATANALVVSKVGGSTTIHGGVTLDALSTGFVRSNSSGVISSAALTQLEVQGALGSYVAGVSVTGPIGNSGSSTAPNITWSPAANVAMGGYGFTGCASLDNNGGAVAIGANASSVNISHSGVTTTIYGNVVFAGSTIQADSTTIDFADRIVHVNSSTGVVAAPTQICGVAIDRGATAGPTKRDMPALVWSESASKIKLAFITAGDDATVGSDLDLTVGAVTASSSLSVSGVVTFNGDAASTTQTRGVTIVNNTNNGTAQYTKQLGFTAFSTGGTQWNAGVRLEPVNASHARLIFFTGSGSGVPSTEILRLDNQDDNLGPLVRGSAFAVSASAGFRFDVSSNNRGGLKYDTGSDYIYLESYGNKDVRIRTGANGSGSGGVDQLIITGTGTITATWACPVLGTTFTSTPVNVTDASSVTIDLSTGLHQRVPLSVASTDITLSNARAGTRYLIHTEQDASGNRTTTWTNTISWCGLTTTPDLTALKFTIWELYCWTTSPSTKFIALSRNVDNIP